MHDSSKKIIRKAQIYKVEFKISEKNYIYIGLDTKCDPNYFGSSLIIYHYQRIFGDKIFDKSILEELTNISHNDLCAIEQKYIKESKNNSKKNNQHSINYTGQNRRESGPSFNVAIDGKKIINEARKIGLNLRMASLAGGIMKPTNPPAPFDKGSGGGMHIETNYGLKRIGFSFFKQRGSDNNIGVATSILRQLEFDDDSISVVGPADLSDYQYVLAIHNSTDHKHIAGLFNRLVNLVYDNSHLFSNDTNDNNETLPQKNIVESIEVDINSEKFIINRYKSKQIRVVKEGMSSPMPNTKEFLRDVVKEYALIIEDKYWSQTQRVGKRVIDALKMSEILNRENEKEK